MNRFTALSFILSMTIAPVLALIVLWTDGPRWPATLVLTVFWVLLMLSPLSKEPDTADTAAPEPEMIAHDD